MESLFLVNPRRRKRRHAQPAALRRYWAARRRGSGTRKRRRKARAIFANPRRRRHHSRRRRHNARRRSRTVRVIRANPRRRRRARMVFHRRRRRRHNPFSTSNIGSMVEPAAIGAAGGIALSLAVSYGGSYLPDSLTSGYGAAAVQAAGAIALGMIAAKFMGKQYGQWVGAGALTVVLVETVVPMLSSAAGLSGIRGLNGLNNTSAPWQLADYRPYVRSAGVAGMGAYMKNPAAAGLRGMGRLGFVSPAAVLQRKKLGAYMARPVPGMAGIGGTNEWNGWQNDGM